MALADLLPKERPLRSNQRTLPVEEGCIIDLSTSRRQVGLIDAAGSKNNPIDRIDFRYTFDSFDDTKSANYGEINVIGRSEPILGYSGSGPRIFNIPLIFAHAGATGAGGLGINPYQTHWEEVIRPVWLVRSWLYPDYSNPMRPNVPPILLLVMGSWLSQRCVARSASVRYHGPWGRGRGIVKGEFGDNMYETGSIQFDMPIGFNGGVDPFKARKDSMLPTWVEINIVLQEVMDNTSYTPYDMNQVRQGYDTGTGFNY
jgi:hypothetical protein